MTIKVETARLFVQNLHSRIPFRYGIAELRVVPHLFVRLDCLIDGRLSVGSAADSLIPKWFTKDPETSYQQDVEQMLIVIQEACKAAAEAGVQDTPFDLWRYVHGCLRAWALKTETPPLLWSFGASLVERAVIDAFCRHQERAFFQLLRGGALGLRLNDLHRSLSSDALNSLLPEQPLAQVAVRHTVGLSDPLWEVDLAANERKGDGLPVSLQAAIRAYGLVYFKIKLSGERDADLERLRHIAALLEQERPKGYKATLDGNEQFEHPDQFREFWQVLQEASGLERLRGSILYVEQPLQRSRALSEEVRLAFSRWKDRPAMIIDESDSLPESMKVALHLGYHGTSHKNCKGVFKGIANACLLESLRRTQPGRTLILSGEDLVNTGPVALLQDLAVMAALGIQHVERNGHHYFAGLSAFPADLQMLMCTAHADLYRVGRQGFAQVQVQDSCILLESVVKAPFGLDIHFDPGDWFVPLEDWRFDTLDAKTAQYSINERI